MTSIVVPYSLSFNETTFFKDEFDYVAESYLAEHEMILKEAEEPVKKEGFLHRILSTILRLINLASRALNSIIAFISSLLGRDGKSADQIADEVNIPEDDTEEVQKHVDIEVDPDSEIKISDIDLVTKPFTVSFTGSKFTISSRDVIKNALQHGSKTMIKGKDSNYYFPLKGVHNLVFKLIQLPESDEKMIRVAQELCSGQQISSDASKYLDELVELNTVAAKMTIKNYEIDANRLKAFQQTINTVHSLMRKYDTPDAKVFPGNLEKINQFAKLCNEIQFGINTITQSMKNIYLIDQKYVGKVSDISVLSAFAEKCIQSGMPSKYIAVNIMLITSEKLHGKANPMKPVVGQTRAVLFPPDQNYVLKIALSAMGIRANEAEYKIYQKVKDTPASKYFAAIINLTDNKCVSAMEKINNRRKPNMNELHQFKAELVKVVNDNNIPLNINADMHFDNVRFRDNGDAVTIDYGMAMRTAN